MKDALTVMVGLIMLLALIVAVGKGYLYCAKRSPEPVALLVKWVITIVFLFALFKAAAVGVQSDGVTKVFLLLGMLLPAVFIGIMWAPSVAGVISDPITNVMDGGNFEIEDRAKLETSMAKRSCGSYQEAVYEILQELETHPDDPEALLLVSEIYVENLKDLDSAETYLAQLIDNPEQAANSRAYALNRWVDWQLDLRGDGQGAEKNLRRIIELFPNTEAAQHALQRIPRLEGVLALKEKAKGEGPKTMGLPKFDRSLGLRSRKSRFESSDEKIEQELNYLNEALQTRPEDYELREKLAWLYAYKLDQLTDASSQLEYLIQTPERPDNQIVKWLNQLCDMHLKVGKNLRAARQTLQRIIDRYPETFLAERAKSRMVHIGIESHKQRETTKLKLGSYEKNIGIKRKRNRAIGIGSTEPENPGEVS